MPRSMPKLKCGYSSDEDGNFIVLDKQTKRKRAPPPPPPPKIMQSNRKKQKGDCKKGEVVMLIDIDNDETERGFIIDKDELVEDKNEAEHNQTDSIIIIDDDELSDSRHSDLPSGKTKIPSEQAEVIDIDDDDDSNQLEYQKSSTVSDSGSGAVIDITEHVVSKQENEVVGHTILKRILDVFPDCEINHIFRICDDFGINDDACELNEDHNEKVSEVLVHLAENGYPKEKTDQKKTACDQKELIVSSRRNVPRSYLYDYDSTAWETSPKYREEAIKLLMDDFPLLSKHAITCLFEASKCHYVPTHKTICDNLGNASKKKGCEGAENEEVAASVIIAFIRGEKLSKEQKKALEKLVTNTPGYKKSFTIVLKQPRGKSIPPLSVCDVVLRDELKFDQERRTGIQTIVDALTARDSSQKISISSTLECQCCFSEFVFEEMCQCTDGHLFCVTCLRRYVEEKVFGQQKVDLVCMSGECKCGFGEDQLEKALPEKVRRKYEEAKFQADLDKANIPDLCKCPKCNYQAILPFPETIYSCPDCSHQSCRHCELPPHPHLSCDQVEKQTETNARLRVEEAMTAARVRKCPNCSKKFYKIDGCNKMTCSCGTKICYICRARVRGYDHFCRSSNCKHENCGKCALYTNSIKDDRRAVKEAGLSEKAKAILEANDSSVVAKIDVDKLLK